MEWLFFFEVSLAGLGFGALYALTAVAFVVIYKATRVINLAMGEMLMFGAYLFFGFAAGMALPVWLALVLALLGGALLGLGLERIVIRPLLGENPISVFMVTIGLSSVLVGLVEIIWTATPRSLPDFLPSDPIFIGDAFVAPKTFWSFVIAAVVIGVFLVLFRFWRGGVALRATASDQGAAYAMGINVPAVYSLSWGLAGMLAAGAGILLGSVAGISSEMGVFGLTVLVVVIVGGLDSVLGALVAGLFIGWVESLAGVYLGGEYEHLMTFIILMVVLLLRPWGLFGTREIERL
ncbi:branched-chain amino acid ABC transporter permease [Aquisalimonas lutea]|uniref:branched-chain amino acid ABC transporter permease n=1 Tax=Aquisalimonas lutea TaxID=1327750 RepID=UPI0025B4EBFC|nr:branched-chain amino acid ABC transporter permease [Aquisalimonas lutea]MDN3517627.1 branched-chain amino acid ABC transporter permease [Aquisalimonas lutea]